MAAATGKCNVDGVMKAHSSGPLAAQTAWPNKVALHATQGTALQYCDGQASEACLIDALSPFALQPGPGRLP
jgi:hypothetical protein